MIHFNSINPIELGVITDVIAIALADGNSADDNNVLGNFLVAVGSIILTVAAQQAAIESSKSEVR
jgi:hypothetical protein